MADANASGSRSPSTAVRSWARSSPSASADALEQALGAADPRRQRASGALELEAEDGRYTIALQRVVYVKRFARESRVGFGAAALER